MSLEIRNRYDRSQLLLVKQEIDDLRTKKTDDWQEKAVKIIKKARLDIPSLELMRLRFFEILTPESEKNLDLAINQLEAHPDKIVLKIMIAQAMEIQKIYGETHHVFIHAQNSEWILFPDLVKELMKIHHPDQDVHQFKFLRMPNLSRPWDITRYSENPHVDDHNQETRIDLLSTDGHFFHNHPYESSLHFLSINDNIGISFPSVFQETIQHFHPEMSNDSAIRYAEKMIQESKNAQGKMGNLFVLCIPKDKSPSIQYRAHPFGVPCTCHPASENGKILESLQKMDTLDSNTKCSQTRDPCPQFRIFTPELKKENGVKIYLISSDRAKRKQFKQKIKAIISEFAKKKSLLALAEGTKKAVSYCRDSLPSISLTSPKKTTESFLMA